MPVTSAHISGQTPLPTLDGVDVSGKRVLLRVDYNIPALSDGTLYDDYRIASTLPTIRRLMRDGARVGILTHRGRPGGRIVPELSTQPLARMLSELLGQKVHFVPDCIGRVAQQAMTDLPPGQVLMFENVRYHLGEQMNQQPFVQQLAALGDVFVNDAFAATHRAHASTSGLASAMKPSVVGDLMVRELDALRKISNPGKRPFILVLGGNNVEPKIELLQHLLTHVDTVMLGGVIANTFMAARDLGMGQSRLDPGFVDMARDILTEAGVVGCRLHLPQDIWVAPSGNTRPADARPTHMVGPTDTVIDIGPKTLAQWSSLMKHAGAAMVLGSVGMIERQDGLRGTLGLMETLAEQRTFSLVSGNGMLPLLHREGLRERLPALSSGEASVLAALLGKPLPSLDVLL